MPVANKYRAALEAERIAVREYRLAWHAYWRANRAMIAAIDRRIVLGRRQVKK